MSIETTGPYAIYMYLLWSLVLLQRGIVVLQLERYRVVRNTYLTA